MIKPGIQIQLKNTEELCRRLKNSSVSGFNVGVFAEAKNPETGASVADYARYNEMGTKDIPPRPFLGITARQHYGEWRQMCIDRLEGKKGWRGFLDACINFIKGNRTDVEKQVREALEKVGEIAVADVQATIRSDVPPPNYAKYAIAKARKRGRWLPTLIDTGTMLNNITFKFIDRNGSYK